MSNTQTTPVTSRPSSENFSKENPFTSSGSTSTPPTSASKTFGVSIWNETGSKVDNSPAPGDKVETRDAKLNRKESYKAQRKSYRIEKKRAASELMHSIQDPTVIVLEDWLKVRGTLKSWTKLWCVLKPGLLLIYKSQKAKSNHWVGTVLLTSCQVIERPSKKDGFCFKLFHRLEQSIWAPRGPERETMGAMVQPLPTSYLIFRAASQAAGKCWMDALELSLRCSALLIRSVSNNITPGDTPDAGTHAGDMQWSEADYEKHFNEHDLDVDSQTDATLQASAGESDSESEAGDVIEEVEEITESSYVYSPEPEFGAAGEQVEELPEEHKSLIWFLVKQVRPGMDLSKVVLPTFILEPRSFLDKLSDSYYHADFLSKAVTEDDPFTRMKTVVQWYMSGFYKKPKGLKKPYNPILGETFRCYWEHPNGSRTFYISEQVSHHPPVSAFYVTNRQDGFCISCTILAKSKFYGNSTSAILDGVATLTLLPRGESYTLTIPYAHCKGILMGTLTMELGGKINIECENTGYKAELEFKLKPFIGGSEYTNLVTGKIKLGKETMASINGHWDSKIKIKDAKGGEESVLFEPTPEMRGQRLKRFTVPIEAQDTFESERMWQHVSAAILRDDQVGATEEKTALEEAQRAATKERKATCSEWVSRHFTQDLLTGNWHYKYADLRAWDPRNDVRQYESEYRIQTKTRHQAPMVRTASIISSEPLTLLQADSRTSLQALKHSRRALAVQKMSGNSTPEHGLGSSDDSTAQTKSKILETLETLEKKIDDQSVRITRIQQHVDQIQSHSGDNFFRQSNIITIAIVLFAVLLNSVLTAFMNRKHYP